MEETFLKSVALFAEFEPDELMALSRDLQKAQFTPGDSILDEGNANRALHILKSGRIRVSRRVESGEVTLCDLEAGQTFGELSIIEDGVASASLRAADAGDSGSASGDRARGAPICDAAGRGCPRDRNRGRSGLAGGARRPGFG